MQSKILEFAPYLLLLYLIIAGQTLGGLVSCNVQQLLNNHLFRHVMAFSTLAIFIIYTEIADPLWSFVLSSILYSWFVFSTRMDYGYIIALGLCFFIMYVLRKLEQFLLRHDESMDKEENKPIIYRWLKEQIDVVPRFSVITFYIAIAITIIGFFVYLGRKSVEYEKNWSWFKFMFGSENCKYNSDITKKIGCSHITLFMRGLQKTVGLK